MVVAMLQNRIGRLMLREDGTVPLSIFYGKMGGDEDPPHDDCA